MRLLLRGLVLVALLATRLRAQDAEVMKINVDRANMRSAPSVDSAVVRGLSRGVVVTVIARDGAWVKIQVQGQSATGWVRRDLLIASAPGSASPPPASAPPPRAASAPPRQEQARAPPPPPPPARRTQEPERQISSPGYKDPGTAMILSVLIVGGGQIYSGETGRGFAMLGIGLGSVILGCGVSGNLSVCELGLLVDLGVWVYSVVDAEPSARRMNQAHGARVSLIPFVIPTSTPRVGLALSVRF